MSDSPDVSWSRWLPWRWAWLPWPVAVAALVAGVPLFLRMPPWCDLTLYDVAARNLLAGGVHYRDVFDTNLPGFVWALTGIRAAFGWSVEAVRTVDLLIVVGIVTLLDRSAAMGGASRAARGWAVAGAAILYPFLPEFNHAQRDVWMTLPAVAAVVLRCRRLSLVSRHPSPAMPFVEGLLWGVAVWIKPHVVVPAAAVWLATSPWILRTGGRRAVGRDLAGNVLGGGLLGGLGVAFLVASGTWDSFVEVFTFWNHGYFRQMWAELPQRWAWQFDYFSPWSNLQPVAVGVAALSLVDGLTGRGDGPGWVGRLLPWWAWDAGSSTGVRTARVGFAALYLAWVAQAVLFQRQFHYVHVPETLMFLPILATQRWAAGVVIVGALVVSGVLAARADVQPPPDYVSWPIAHGGPPWAVRHPVFDADRMAEWPNCWRTGLTPVEYRERMDAVGEIDDFHPANWWAELGDVADWLNARGATAETVLCWHDAPHALYLDLPGRPRFRFMHVSHISCVGGEQFDRIEAEFGAAVPGMKWVVTDLLRAMLPGRDPRIDWRAAGPDMLPPDLDPAARDRFPFDRPAVFRSGGGHGRYVVHDLRAGGH